VHDIDALLVAKSEDDLPGEALRDENAEQTHSRFSDTTGKISADAKQETVDPRIRNQAEPVVVVRECSL
jgi:hypothetical protein